MKIFVRDGLIWEIGPMIAELNISIIGVPAADKIANANGEMFAERFVSANPYLVAELDENLKIKKTFTYDQGYKPVPNDGDRIRYTPTVEPKEPVTLVGCLCTECKEKLFWAPESWTLLCDEKYKGRKPCDSCYESHCESLESRRNE